jgi:competence protein ComEC
MFGLPGESDAPRQLAYQRIYATGFVMQAEDLVLLQAGTGWPQRIDRLAAELGSFIMARVPGPEGGILKALLIGDTGDVPAELNDAYARSGVNHILSISGFHVGIVFLCTFQVLFLWARCSESLALRLNLRRVLMVAALPAVLFYLVLSGTQPATLRSVLMIVAVLLAMYVKREQDPVNSIMLAALAILLPAPETLFNLSFQLSFLAIWGLVVVAPVLSCPVEHCRRPLRWFLLLLVASAAAILATLVPVAYYFHRVSLTGLVANLVVVPLMGYGAVVAGCAALPLALAAPDLAGLLLQFAAWMVRLSDKVIVYLAALPVWEGYVPTRFDLLCSILALAALSFVRSRLPARALTLGCAVILMVRGLPAEESRNGMLHVIFLSIGQGDSALVQLPDGKRMLVDGGGNYSDADLKVGERLLGPALHALGVKRLDYLVLSHPHPDHLQGLLWAAAHLDVGEFWEGALDSTAAEYLALKWVLTARGVPVRRLAADSPPFQAGGVRFEPLWPVAGSPVSGDTNDTSLVLRLVYGASSVLFTGDLGGRSERALLDRGVPLTSTLLKVAHHGSRYSSSDRFLDAAAPRCAVISAGYRNSFRLPAPATLMRLQRHAAKVYRTDQEGTLDAALGADGSLSILANWGHFN